MDRNMMICIFCGNKADIVKKGRIKTVICSHCKRETELNTYQAQFDEWIDDIHKEGK